MCVRAGGSDTSGGTVVWVEYQVLAELAKGCERLWHLPKVVSV